MQYKIMYQPSYSLLELQLDPSGSVVAESDAMVSMTPNVNMETGAKGGLFGALKRAVGGESMFQNTFTAQDGPGRVAFAPTMVGDIAAREMRGESLFVQSGSFLASSPSIELDTKWGGGPDVLLQRRAVRPQSHRCGHALHVQLRCHPCGHTCSRGAAGHGHWPYMVAFDATMGYHVRTVGGLKQTLFSGEGLVVDLTGPGTIYMQTRNFGAFVNYLVPKLPFKRD